MTKASIHCKPIHKGFGSDYEFYLPGMEYYSPLELDKLMTLPQCKKWLRDNNHGYTDVKKEPIGCKTSMKFKFVRRLRIEIYPPVVDFNRCFDSRYLTIMQFRQVVTWFANLTAKGKDND